MRNDPSITCELVRSIYDYDRETGVFSYKASRGRMSKGSIAGTVKKGYGVLAIGGKFFQASRVAWLYVHGSWPINDIDHINHNPLDNRIENLRDISHQANMHNQSRARVNNKTGVVGVYYFARNKRYHAQINIKGKPTFLGSFSNIEDAEKAYLKAKATHHAIPA